MNAACTICGRRFRLRDGVIVFHRQQWAFDRDTTYTLWPQPPCPGWGRPPKDNA